MENKPRLGKGLNALIPQRILDNREQIIELDIDKIVPNPYQPRQEMESGSLSELADSIRSFGVLQPIIVVSEAGEYQLIAGHRRWQASRKAGRKTIPAIVRQHNHQEQLELALVENVQREDLNCVEEARAYQRLRDEFNLQLKEIANRVGKKLPTISNTIRLLSLPPLVLEGLSAGKITEGHARALLGLQDPHVIELAYGQILHQQLSVRAVEELVKKHMENAANSSAPKSSRPLFDKWQHQEKNLMDRLGTKVQIRERQGKGSISLEFYSEEELSRLIEMLLLVDD